jgi:hypothetical protein
MLITKPSWFEVVGKQNGEIWLQVHSGEDQGRRVSVPRMHSEYSDQEENQLENLSVADLCKVTLLSDSETAPDWRVDEIDEIRRQSPQAHKKQTFSATAQVSD